MTQSLKRNHALGFSVIFNVLALVSTTVVHYSKFGHPALIAGVIFAGLMLLSAAGFHRSRQNPYLIGYGLLATILFIGFGLYNGFWNHGMKLAVYYMHNHQLPPFLASAFADPAIGTPLIEISGILTFVFASVGFYFTVQIIRTITGGASHEKAY